MARLLDGRRSQLGMLYYYTQEVVPTRRWQSGGRESPALEALCVLASELAEPTEDDDAEGAAGRAARDALDVPLEACLALRALALLGCRATDQAADALASAARVPLDCDCRGTIDKRRGDRLAFLAASCRVLRRRRDRRLGF